jgi:hypothetical protein
MKYEIEKDVSLFGRAYIANPTARNSRDWTSLV